MVVVGDKGMAPLRLAFRAREGGVVVVVVLVVGGDVAMLVVAVVTWRLWPFTYAFSTPKYSLE